VADDSYQPQDARRDDDSERIVWIERSVLVLLFLALLVCVAMVLRPFATAILFGAALATAAWPLRQALVRRGLGHGTVAALLFLSSLALLVVPVLVVAPSLVEQLGKGVEQAKSYFAVSPQKPAWIVGLPLVGRQLAAVWDRIVEAEGDLRALIEPYAATLEQIVVAAARALADSVLQVILSLVVATMFWKNGDVLVEVIHRGLRRLGGAAADQALDVAAGAIRGVAYGVVGTAAIQAVLLAAGLAVAGVPAAAMLGFIALLLAISQIGAPLLILIWGGAAWWLFREDHGVWGLFMIILGVIVSTVDNFLKPLLIGFGIRMPLSLTILGVFGGFIAFGFLGLFIGPSLIAVMFTLLQAWLPTAPPVNSEQIQSPGRVV
jgi:predicted PurR-regulated permease PerM